MTEGMITRGRALDEQLTSIAEQLSRHDAIFTKLDTVCTTVQQHSDNFDNIHKSFDSLHRSLASQQTVMADLMVKISKLETTTTSPPLLPLPTTPAPSRSFPPNPNQPPPMSMPPSRMPKLEIPLFAGDDVLHWLFQINHFFNFHQIPADQKLIIAGFYMTGPALQWYHWMYSTSQLQAWEDFSRKLELRFGPSSFINHEAQLYKLQQRTTVTKYLQDFECLSTRISGLNSNNLLNCFLSGLRDDIQRELFLLKPPSLHEAMGMARLVEDKCNAARANPLRHGHPFRDLRRLLQPPHPVFTALVNSR